MPRLPHPVRRLMTAATLLGVCLPAIVVADDATDRLLDRAAIENLVVAYVTALDTRDADAYAGVFTEDAVFDIAGNVRNGREEVRAIITGLQENQARNADAPTSALYHVMSNTAIQIVDASHARHSSYWQTVRVDPDGSITVGAMGRYEDEIVKRNGRWLIASRKLTNFAQ